MKIVTITNNELNLLKTNDLMKNSISDKYKNTIVSVYHII